jgi:predicted SprT family Zn-dependent metalloprotease
VTQVEVEKTTRGFICAAKDQLLAAGERYDLDLSDVKVNVTIRGSRISGYAALSGAGSSRMDFNRQNLMYQWDDILGDTLPHEIAHIVCFRKGWDKGHGARWKEVCIELGGSGEQCVHPDLHYIGREGSWKYQGTTGHVYWVNRRTHTFIQAGNVWSTMRGDRIGPANYMGYMRPTGQFKPTVAASVSLASARSSVDPYTTTDPVAQYVTERLRQKYSNGIDALYNLRTASGIAAEVGMVNPRVARAYIKKAIINTFDDVAHLRE